ncbi:ECF-type sigma factor [soil metagenome]
MTDVVTLLARIARGDSEAVEALYTTVYSDLKQLAAGILIQEKPGQTLQPTALVHEVYLRLAGGTSKSVIPFESRAHFFGAAANAMRQILVDAARKKATLKRGGPRVRQDLDPETIAAPEAADQLLDLDEALTRFAVIEPHMAQLVHLRYFSGLTLQEAAESLGISERTAYYQWSYARAWLQEELQD